MLIQNKSHSLGFLIFLFLTLELGPPNTATAQADFDLNTRNLSPATIVIIIIGVIFILTGFLAVFLRQFSAGCFGLNVVTNPAFPTTGLPRRGLDPEAIKSLPTYFYSDVKQHRKGKVQLECAVCLSEFQDSEALRLLPGCSHVFHPRCIDTWLASHVTCPICRQTLEPGSGADKPTATNTIISIPLTGSESDGPDQFLERDHYQQHHDDDNNVGGYKSAGESDEKEMKRSVRKFPRSHSTGHSLANSDRFTLRLPDDVRTNLANRSGDTLTVMPSPRCGWFSMTPPIIFPRTSSIRSPLQAGLNIPGFKKQPQSPVKTSEHLWPI